MSLLVERFAYTPMGAFGIATLDDFSCYTLEDPWKMNQRGVSCIPVGVYDLKWGVYNKGGYPAFEILDVPDRTYIKIHKGNTHLNVEGCIVLGEKLGYIGGNWAITHSTKAFNRFMAHAKVAAPEQITIRNYVGGVL